MDKATGLVISAGTVALSKFVVEAEKYSTASASRFRSTRTGLYMNLIILVAIIEMDGNLSDHEKAWILKPHTARIEELGNAISQKSIEAFESQRIRTKCMTLFADMYSMYVTARDASRLKNARTKVINGAQRIIAQVPDFKLRQNLDALLPAPQTIAYEVEASAELEEDGEDGEISLEDAQDHLATLLLTIELDPYLEPADKELLLNPTMKARKVQLEIRFGFSRVPTTADVVTGTYDGLKWDVVTLSTFLGTLYSRFGMQRKLSNDLTERVRTVDAAIAQYHSARNQQVVHNFSLQQQLQPVANPGEQVHQQPQVEVGAELRREELAHGAADSGCCVLCVVM
jgi:hypothetical protein